MNINALMKLSKDDEKMKYVSIAISVAGVIASLIKVYQFHNKNKRIVSKYKIYSAAEAAKLIGVHQDEVKVLVDNGELKGKNINGIYQVIGKSIINFFS